MTKYFKGEEIDNKIIKEISLAIKKGKLVVFPTDTVYGIGTNAYNGVACEKIYDVKGRPSYKPLIILIAEREMLNDLVDKISPVEQRLMDSFWPGSLTIKLKKKVGVLPDVISAGDDYLRVRLVNEGLIYQIIKEAKVPVVAPSANLSKSLTGVKIKNIINELDGKVDYILDCGDMESDVTSTIVEVVNEEIIVIREGKIKSENLEKIAPIKILSEMK